MDEPYPDLQLSLAHLKKNKNKNKNKKNPLLIKVGSMHLIMKISYGNQIILA